MTGKENGHARNGNGHHIVQKFAVNDLYFEGSVRTELEVINGAIKIKGTDGEWRLLTEEALRAYYPQLEADWGQQYLEHLGDS